jgi:hypothetical protein
MAARESNEVLVGLLGRAQALPEVRNSALFEGDHRCHREQNTLAAVNFLLKPGRLELVKPKNKDGGALWAPPPSSS